MWNVNSNYKKFAYTVIFIFILAGFVYFNRQLPVTFAENSVEIEQELSDNIDDLLDDIETEELDDFIENDFDIDFLASVSFLDLVKSILSGKYFEEYDSIVDFIIEFLKENIKNLILFILTMFSIVVVFELFNNFCVNKYADLKKMVKVIFSLIIALTLLAFSRNIFQDISATINKIFDFSKILFPILLGLILISGASGTYSVYNSLSIYILNTGSYIFVYILLPLIISIIILSIIGCLFQKNKFSKVISVLKSVFKHIIIIFLAVFGIFSSINAVSSGVLDGVNYKITKFAIKSYVPVLGGYLSDGFDFLHTCSVLIKNSFGICGIIILFFMVIKPILNCIIFSFALKVVSVLVSFVESGSFSDYFENVSSTISYLVTIVVGIFLCLFIYIYLIILSVSVI